MLTNRSSATRLRARLADRTELSRAQAIAQYWATLPPGPLAEIADLIELELSLPFGLLRPDDSLRRLLAPFPLGNPLTWLWAEAALEDGISEINYQLAARSQNRHSPAPATVGELIAQWCGAAV